MTPTIEDVCPNEIRGFIQHHFFAGICGWSLALDIAGWPRSRSVVTGSCPCQSFSAAGKGLGFADQRHLWPAWFHIIRELAPATVFGEQVAAAIRFGWLDLVSADLEAEGYAIGGAVLGAHSVGAPHIRQRLYFVAQSDEKRHDRTERRTARLEDGRSRMGDASSTRLAQQFSDAGIPRIQGGSFQGEATQRAGWYGEWRTGADGKARLLESGLEPLAYGVPARVVRLRGYGNAICPQTAAAFIAAYMAGESVVELAA